MGSCGSNAPRVAVVGGGYAGMAAAVELAERAVRPTVFEAARHLGGRARLVSRNGLKLDNGQHILVGAYRETLRLVDLVGTPAAALMRLPLQWQFPPHFSLRTRGVPAPWHMALGLLRARGISMAARLRCARFFAWCQRRSFRLAGDTSVSALLRQHGQHPDAIRFLWEPLCVAALNTPLEHASAQVFLSVLRDGLAAQRSASDLILPRVDLTRLFPSAAAECVIRHGGTVELGSAVTRIDRRCGAFAVTTNRGEEIYSAVILATQPSRAASILGHLEELADPLRRIGAFTYQPIVTVYMQYPRPCSLPFPMLGMSGQFGQWLFDRSAISGQPGLLAAVISAYGRRQKLSHEQLAQRVRAEVSDMMPGLGTPDWTRVIEEKQATFTCTPDLQRPDQRTEIPGLFLAGDYTASDYPATLEAAVRSGVRCAGLAAEAVLA